MINHETNETVVEPFVEKEIPSETPRWNQTIQEANEVQIIDVTKENKVSMVNFHLFICIKF